MKQLNDHCKANKDVLRRKNKINSIKTELQRMKACLSKGLTLQDYINTQEHLTRVEKII